MRFERSTDGLRTWHAGYVSPDDQYIAIEQTQGATSTWVAAQTNRGRAEGTLQAAGRTWEKIRRGDKVQISLVHRGAGPKDVTTILTGTAPYDELVTFARAPAARHPGLSAGPTGPRRPDRPTRPGQSVPLPPASFASAPSSQVLQWAARASPRCHRAMLSSRPICPPSSWATIEISSSRACS